MHARKTLQLIERISTLVRSEERKRYAAYGLQPIHGQILEYLAQCNKHSNTPAAITEYLGLTKGTVSQSIQILVRNNYIEKHADENDQRVIHLTLTNAGKQLVESFLPIDLFEQVEEEVSNSDFSSLDDALVSTLVSLQQANHSKTFGLCKSCHYFAEIDHHYHCNLTQLPLTPAETELICREHIPPQSEVSE
jgi:DNA-binding MarR family transcriptional regulator